ncbi:hypothetical protein DDE05_48630, partial [Streptomyces cavourensis]
MKYAPEVFAPIVHLSASTCHAHGFWFVSPHSHVPLPHLPLPHVPPLPPRSDVMTVHRPHHPARTHSRRRRTALYAA